MYTQKMITLIIGPMFSGKTTLLLGYERRFRIAKQQVLLVKYSEDNRYSTNSIVSHDGVSSTNQTFNTTKLSDISSDVLASVDTILIDEGQFFEDLHPFCELHGDSKQIIISGLSGDYKRQPFQPIADLIPLADTIQHCKGICASCGADAPYSKRLSAESSQKVIGGIDKYQPCCRKCFTSTSASYSNS